MTSTTTKQLAGISLAALLALTACGSDSDAEAGNSNTEDLPDTDGEGHAMPESDGTYDFTPNTAAASGEEIRIEVPQELIALTDTYSEDRVLDAVTVRATEDTEAQCGIEIDYEYRDGAQDEIENTTWVRARGNNQDTDMPADERYPHALFTTTDMGWLEDGDNENSFVNTVALAEDYQNAVSEVDCAASPNDTENTTAIEFKELNWTDGHQPQALPESLATADVAVMASGEVHVVNSSVEGYDHEPDHGWIGEDQQVDSDGNVIDG